MEKDKTYGTPKHYHKKNIILDSLPKTCADCRWHKCSADIHEENTCLVCTGTCTKSGKSKICHRLAGHCNMFEEQKVKLRIDYEDYL